VKENVMHFAVFRRTLLVAALSFIGVAGASAQEQPAEFPTYLSPGLTFTPGVSLSGMWDSNVALAAPTGRAASDQLFVVQPFGQVQLVTPRTELVGGYTGYVRRYMDADALNGFDQRGFISLRRRATRRVTFSVTNEFADVPTTDETELNGLPFTRTGSKSNRLAAGVGSRVGKFTDVNVRYENTWVKFDRDDAALNDGWINSLEGDLRRRLNERVSVGAEYGIRRADVDSGSRTIWFHDMGGLVSYALGPRTRLEVAGGYSFLNDSMSERFDDSLPEQLEDTVLERDRRGLYGRAGVEHAVERATFGASFEKSFVPSFGFGGSSASQELRGFIQMPLNRNRLYLQTNALWRRTNPLELEELALDTIQSTNTVGYALVRWLRLEAFHVFTRQDSIVTGGEINRQRAGLQLVVSQPMRIR
jgi:hypothetical protein